MLHKNYLNLFRQKLPLKWLKVLGSHQYKTIRGESRAFLMSKLWLKEANQGDLKDELRRHEEWFVEGHSFKTNQYLNASNKNDYLNKGDDELISIMTLIHHHLQDSDDSFRKLNSHSTASFEKVLNETQEDKYSYLDFITRDISCKTFEEQIDIKNESYYSVANTRSC